MHQKLMVVLDTTPASRMAVIEGIGMAMLARASIHFLHIMPPYSPPAAESPALLGWTLDDHLLASQKTAAKLIKAALRDAEIAGVTATSEAVFGSDPAEAIVENARRKRCDLIVIGSLGRSALQRFLFGSVVTRLLTLSPYPVLVCKQGKLSRKAAIAVSPPPNPKAASKAAKPDKPRPPRMPPVPPKPVRKPRLVVKQGERSKHGQKRIRSTHALAA